MLITARKAAKIIGISMRTMYNRIKTLEHVKKVGKEKYYNLGEIRFVALLKAEQYEDRRWDCEFYGACLMKVALKNGGKMPCRQCKEFKRARLDEDDFMMDLAGCHHLFAAMVDQEKEDLKNG